MVALITIQSSLTSEILSLKMPKGVDKLIHFSIFGTLGWVMTRGMLKSESNFMIKNYFWIVPLFTGLFAIIDEYHQALVPGRFPDYKDWIADFLGVLFFMWLYQKRNRNQKPT